MPLEFFIVIAAALGATIGFWSSAILVARRQTRLYTRGWNAGREFEATRQLRQTLENSHRRQ